MPGPHAVARLRSKMRESSWFAFGATTAALVLLASGGTAVLVHFGVDDGQGPIRSHRAAPAPARSAPAAGFVTVDRVVGSFLPPSAPLPRTAQDEQTLASVLLPSVGIVDVEPPSAPPPAPEAPLVPAAPELPLGPPPPPQPPTVHPPVLPMPNPGPIPLPLPVPPTLPVPLPSLPLPLPGS